MLQDPMDSVIMKIKTEPSEGREERKRVEGRGGEVETQGQ